MNNSKSYSLAIFKRCIGISFVFSSFISICQCLPDTLEVFTLDAPFQNERYDSLIIEKLSSLSPLESNIPNHRFYTEYIDEDHWDIITVKTYTDSASRVWHIDLHELTNDATIKAFGEKHPDLLLLEYSYSNYFSRVEEVGSLLEIWNYKTYKRLAQIRTHQYWLSLYPSNHEDTNYTKSFELVRPIEIKNGILIIGKTHKTTSVGIDDYSLNEADPISTSTKEIEECPSAIYTLVNDHFIKTP